MPYARRTDAAQRDLEGIAFQIALRDHRPLVADRIIDELIAQTDKLARFSKVSTLGTPVPDLQKFLMTAAQVHSTTPNLPRPSSQADRTQKRNKPGNKPQ